MTEDVCSESLLQAGWGCHDDVMWAKSTGIHQHPEWYRGLTASSTEEAFQSHLSQLPDATCPRPCYQSPSQCEIDLSLGSPGGNRYSCYGGGRHSAAVDVCTPDGSGGANLLSSQSDYRDGCPVSSGVLQVHHFANLLCTGQPDQSYSSFMDGQCVGRCCNRDASNCDLSCTAYMRGTTTCDHVATNSECANQVRWAMMEGINLHPEWYVGLTAQSSFLDFQRYTSGLPLCSENGYRPPCYGASERCPTPCL